MSKSFESNIAKELKLKELAAVARRIEKYQTQLEEILSDSQKSCSTISFTTNPKQRQL
ncbi:MAG: hypothetical protein RSC87_10080 [Muribaculaceae bacterium]